MQIGASAQVSFSASRIYTIRATTGLCISHRIPIRNCPLYNQWIDTLVSVGSRSEVRLYHVQPIVTDTPVETGTKEGGSYLTALSQAIMVTLGSGVGDNKERKFPPSNEGQQPSSDQGGLPGS